MPAAGRPRPGLEFALSDEIRSGVLSPRREWRHQRSRGTRHNYSAPRPATPCKFDANTRHPRAASISASAYPACPPAPHEWSGHSSTRPLHWTLIYSAVLSMGFQRVFPLHAAAAAVVPGTHMSALSTVLAAPARRRPRRGMEAASWQQAGSRTERAGWRQDGGRPQAETGSRGRTSPNRTTHGWWRHTTAPRPTTTLPLRYATPRCSAAQSWNAASAGARNSPNPRRPGPWSPGEDSPCVFPENRDVQQGGAVAEYADVGRSQSGASACRMFKLLLTS